MQTICDEQCWPVPPSHRSASFRRAKAPTSVPLSRWHLIRFLDGQTIGYSAQVLTGSGEDHKETAVSRQQHYGCGSAAQGGTIYKETTVETTVVH